jgi:hypothetical protein
MMLGDTEGTLTRACHEQIEAEANYGAGRLLFLGPRFGDEASATAPSLEHVRALSRVYGNTMTATLWRYIEQAHGDVPMVALVTGHPHPVRRANGFDAAQPCKYCVQSPAFELRFGHISEIALFSEVVRYCGAQGGGTLGSGEVILADRNGAAHAFHFETFFNRYEALTLGAWKRPYGVVV